MSKWLCSSTAREAWGSLQDLGFRKCTVKVKEADHNDPSIILHPPEYTLKPGPVLGTKGRPTCLLVPEASQKWHLDNQH